MASAAMSVSSAALAQARPGEVLTALLDGTSYNVMMVGDLPNGAPRQLLLTRKASGGASSSTDTVRMANPECKSEPGAAHGDQDNPDDNASPDDSSDDTAPPMQYTPPSIAPADPPTSAPADPPTSAPTNSPSEALPPRPMPQMQSAPQ